MKRAFTLLELLVVVAIMGLLGAAATSSYSALVRGMRERSAVTTASSVLRMARERAHIDRKPTAVFCYNRLLKAPTSTENGVVVGVMTAVRQAGRLSFVSGRNLCDEFADLDKTYETETDEGKLANGGGVRLYKFDGTSMSEMKYSIVSTRARPYETSVYLTSLNNGAGGTTNVTMMAYYDLNRSIHQPTWRTGDSYAFEISETFLPEGIIFGSNVPSSTAADKLVGTLVFDPESSSDKTISLSSTRPDTSGLPQAVHEIGTASSDPDEAI